MKGFAGAATAAREALPAIKGVDRLEPDPVRLQHLGPRDDALVVVRVRRQARGDQLPQHGALGLQLELAPNNESGYAGVFPTTSSRWQATIRMEREGKKVWRNVGTFGTKEEAAVQRALAVAGFGDVASPAVRAARSKGVRMPELA